MELLQTHMPQGLIVLGILALIVEVALLGFSSIVLFFAGISLCISGGLMLLGLLPETLAAALWSNALLTGLLALVLWKPFRKLQKSQVPQKLDSDFARDSFVISVDVDLNGQATHKYSGIVWKLKSEQPIKAGTRVRVERTDVGVMWVTPVE
ncbi:NfeD family protein [Oceanobacter mangrovi]|uniref:NfeD family protein n=1 Tax=Oceanobacter mangrovi TaxID=2862510 RepID=UPI001C8DDFE2|nr:NfeD family protein [Oceanobacter mangrovi]